MTQSSGKEPFMKCTSKVVGSIPVVDSCERECDNVLFNAVGPGAPRVSSYREAGMQVVSI